MDQSFPKTRRIRDSRDFTFVIGKGAYAADDVLVVNCVVSPRSESSVPKQLTGRLGISIPKKTGNAVVRNHWKRLIREAYRRQRGQLPAGFDFVVRPRRGATADYQRIANALARLCRLASKQAKNFNKPASNSDASNSDASKGVRK